MEKQHAFQRLKQPCVRLLQVTSQLPANPASRPELVQALSDLLNVLHSLKSRPGVLDAKLAEYAFVPISQVLKISSQVSVRALELCLDCISSLLRSGWGEVLEPALAGQLIILFTFLSKSSSAQNGLSTTSEELQTLALQCLADLFDQASHTSSSKSTITAIDNIPALGEAVLIVLTSLTEGGSSQIRLQAVRALASLNEALDDDDALASFLPAIVSSLTKLFTSGNSRRPGFRVIEQGLHVLVTVIERLLSDEKTKTLPEKVSPGEMNNGIIVSRSASWLRATSSQFKLALANIFKLENHEKTEVKRALFELCLCIIRDCRIALSDCSGMAIDAMVALASHDTLGEDVVNEIKVLLSADQALLTILVESLHGWIISLPRLMLSKDESMRQRLIRQISISLQLCNERAGMLADNLAINLREAITVIFTDCRGFAEITAGPASLGDDGVAIADSKHFTTFETLTLRSKAQEDVMTDFRLLLLELSRSELALAVVQDLRTSVESGSAQMRLGSYWIIVNLLKDVTMKHPTIEDFLNLGGSNPREELLDDIYSFSVKVLSGQLTPDDVPWQFPALALEIIALQAERYQLEFRAEFSEILLPVLSELGSSIPILRHHAITCLNIISTASGYSSASELVVANVDYIVNSISMKLAVGDISPQAPQVLLMILRLCGPQILPYLDDLIESIFETLERFHGYPRLVELLFAVLKGVAEEGVKSTEFLSIQDRPQRHEQTFGVTAVVDAVRRLGSKDVDIGDIQEKKKSEESFPREPWQSRALEPTDAQENPKPPQQEKLNPPVSRIFGVLLRITELTQHYLTTTSPSLRTALLGLLQTTMPILAKDEDSFLPLINTLWPVVLSRLHDSEGYVISKSLDIISLMCEYGGEFMKTRIESAWELIRKVHAVTKQHNLYRIGNHTNTEGTSMTKVTKGINALTIDSTRLTPWQGEEVYVNVPTRMIWKSLVDLLCSIARRVSIGEEQFEEMLDILEPILDTEEVHEALECAHSDAVWLRRYKITVQRSDSKRSLPSRTLNTSKSGKTPIGKHNWQFLPI